MGTGSWLEILGGIAIALVVVIGVVVIVRNLWFTFTDAKVAYLLGRKTRKTIEVAAHTAGRATGAADEVAGVIGRSFREGRDSAKGKGDTPEGDA